MREVVFFSYTRADVTWVQRLADAVRAAGHFAFLDSYVIAPGDSFPGLIRRAIDQSSIGVVCRSAAADARPWVEAERRALEAAGTAIIEATAELTGEQLLALIARALVPIRNSPRAIVLAAADDEERAREVERALGVPALPTSGEDRVRALQRALGEGRPIVVVWSANANLDPTLGRVLDSALAQDLPTGSRRIWVLRLDETAPHPLLAGILEETNIDRLRRELCGNEDRLAEYRSVARVELARTMASHLEREGRLLLLAPRRGGARALADEVLTSLALEPDQVTRLTPPTDERCKESEYFQELTATPSVGSRYDYTRWQAERVRNRRHVVVLLHDGGSLKHLEALAASLRKLWEQDSRRCRVLVAGSAPAARLRFEALQSSLFSGMRAEHVPPLGVAEIAELLPDRSDQRERLALLLHEITDGHPGFAKEILTTDGPFVGEGAILRLARSGQVRGTLNRRLQQDDKDKRKDALHAAQVLRNLVSGQKARRLVDIEDDTRYPEVRLYYDGMVRQDSDGATQLRCEAVRRAASDALRIWEETRP
jgi:hypothetical protein